MNRNSFIDTWLALSRGQRRATIVLVLAIAILAVWQVRVSHDKRQRREAPSNYSVLQQEIALFRSQADSVLPQGGKSTYVRHTSVVRDTVNTFPKRPSQRAMQPVPRIKDK